MKKTKYITKYNRTNCNTFGGLIYPSDYNTGSCNGNLAARIMSDLKFDEMCRRNCINRYKTEMIN